MRPFIFPTYTAKFCILLAGAMPLLADWVDWRGPNRDGRSPEKNLPVAWSPAGENLAWKAPVGGRSAPVVHGDHVYILTSIGAGKTLQERLVCLHADTGKQLWEQRINLWLSDVPPHRAAWSSPAVDPVTGYVYVFSVHGMLTAFSKDGKKVWERSLAEDFALVTTHGGRTVSPIIDGDLVIVSGISTGWGQYSRAGHRFFAFDRRNGELVYLSAPGGRPYDTTYSPPVIAEIDGVRQLISGAGDGNAHAIKAQTGEPLWRFDVSKRGLNSGVVVNGKIAYITHSEENLDTNEMGLFAAVDATMRGPIKKEQAKFYLPGYQLGFSSPIIDGDRFLQVDNGGNLFAFDVTTGRQIWKQNLGTIQKSSAVLGDGKIYVGTENGKFFILKPHNDHCEKLSEVSFAKAGESEEESEKVIASVAVSGGRIFLTTTKNTYAIGKKQTAAPAPLPQPVQAAAGAVAKWVQVVPAEVMLKPGESAAFHARLFDERGNFIREEKAAWVLEGLKGTIDAAGKFTSGPESSAQAGLIKATVAGVTGTARARVIPPLNWSWDFESIPAGKVPMEWVNCNTKFEVRQEEGNKILVKFADNPATKRARVYMGPADLANYTVQADVRASQKRRQMGDVGLVAARFNLMLFGNAEKLELQTWQPETQRSVMAKYPWKYDTWYTMKLRVQNQPDGSVKAQGKVWLKSDPEPEAWTVERTDPAPFAERHGAPGIYADAPFEVFFDNVKVTKN
ncbi:MAG TPA: PQQ-binding-like beta-propeller repeat protein [Bryobacteraceae bacterium]|nr:PQQ-binding-like beta-propeller repeat protein [Bryobacteraceae bacterium]